MKARRMAMRGAVVVAVLAVGLAGLPPNGPSEVAAQESVFPPPSGTPVGAEWAVGIRSAQAAQITGVGSVAIAMDCIVGGDGDFYGGTLSVVSSDGVGGWTIPETDRYQPAICLNNERGTVSDSDGNVFVIVTDTLDPDRGVLVAGYAATTGGFLWDPIPIGGVGAGHGFWQGADGLLYVASDWNLGEIVVIDPAIGAEIDRWPFDSWSPKSMMTTGLLVGYPPGAPGDFRWYELDGTMVSSGRGVFANRLGMSAGTTGTAYVVERGPTCEQSLGLTRLTPGSPSAAAELLWTAPGTTDAFGLCSHAEFDKTGGGRGIAAHPDGGVVVVYRDYSDGSGHWTAIMIDDSGVVQWKHQMPDATINLKPSLFLDAQGTAIISYQINTPISGGRFVRVALATVSTEGFNLNRVLTTINTENPDEGLGGAAWTSGPGVVYLTGWYRQLFSVPFDEENILFAVSVPEVTWKWEGGLSFAGSEPPLPETCTFSDHERHVTVVAARGSGEVDNDDPTRRDSPGRYGGWVKDELQRALQSTGLVVEEVGVEYDAIGVLDAARKAFEGAYAASASQGADNLIGLLQSIAGRCGPTHPVVLVGFSQGAQVVQEALSQAAATSEIAELPAAIGLIASPMFTWTDPSARGTFSRTATGIAGFADIAVGTGPIPDRYSASSRSWCLDGDAVCDATSDNLVKALTSTVHTEGYGEAEGRVVQNIVALALDRLRARGLPVPEIVSTSGLHGITTAEGLSKRSFGVDQVVKVYQAEVWWSVADQVADGVPVFGYEWDFDDDGVVDYEGSPTAEVAYELVTARGAKPLLEMTSRVRLTGPGGLNETVFLCVDVKRGVPC